MAALSSIGLSRLPARSMAASRTMSPAALAPRAAAARARVFGPLPAEAPHSGNGKRIVRPSASRSRQAATEAGRAPSQPAAYLTHLVKLGLIASWAAAGSLGLAQPVAVLLVVVPSLWKVCAKWRASRAARNRKLKRRHKWETARQAPTPIHLEMMELRHQRQVLGMGFDEYMEAFAMGSIASLALLSAADLILAASPSLPFLGWVTRAVDVTPFGWSTNALKLVTQGPLGALWAVYLQPIITEVIKARRVHLQFRQAAAERRAANAARRSAARSTGQPHSTP